MPGSPKYPVWYLNLVADPRVELRVKLETISGRACQAGTKEKPDLGADGENLADTNREPKNIGSLTETGLVSPAIA
ncbi:MAG: nitroreductase/quinone reductase family protein [Acidimicrobiia bacterium]